MKQLPRGYTLNAVIGAILDAAQLLLDVTGLIKGGRSGAESDAAAGLVLLNIHGNQEPLTERDATQGRQHERSKTEQAWKSPAKTGPWQG